MKFRSFAEGAGIAILLLGSYMWPFLSPNHLAIYHYPYTSAPMAAGLAIDLILAAIFFTAVLSLMDRYYSQIGFAWAVFWGFSIALALDLGRYCWWIANNGGHRWQATTRVGMFFLALAAGVSLWWFLPRVLEKCIKATRIGLALLGCCIVWMVPVLVYTAVYMRGPVQSGFSRPVEMPSRPQRIIWVLMDELSYDQVFDHRQPDVKLPHFDQLKSQSVVFSDVRPIGDSTERILPALFLGRKIDNIRSSFGQDLYFHDAETSRWEPFDQEASIFADAQRLNWTTGVAGWFNPYCHILSNVLDACYWQAINPADRVTVFRAMGSPLDTVLSRIRAFRSASDIQLQAHTREYKDLTSAAKSLIKDESINFAFIHLPVPHPPGIYSRATDTLGVRGSYLDSLVLADKTLGNLLRLIQETKAAPQTTIIVSSDHSWRVYMWRPDPSWTAEDERVSRGMFDPRPFLMIHFPEENTGEVRPEPFSELATHGIIRAMLTGEICSQNDLNRWLNEREAKSRLISGNLAGSGK